ncbi:MAG: AIR synthase-related protein, partial [Oscillospiraceae bacterium]|nr:AIR synthase-related protein [Oscillospiraceae bacterium]
ASSGLHSNGFSLVRKLVEHKGYKYNKKIDSLDAVLGEVLLTPTKLYAKMTEMLTSGFNIKGMANMTGGGWVENIPRMLATDGLKIQVSRDKAPVHKIFNLIQEWGNVDDMEMYSTFNMGIGFTLCVASEDANKIVNVINNIGEQAYILGTVEERFEGEKDIVII